MTDPFDEIVAEEAHALVKLLERDDCKVLVVVIAHDKSDGTICLGRGVGVGCKSGDARAFVEMLDRERDRIASRLIRKAS